MSKMDALRAMREERYEQAQKTAQKAAGKSAGKAAAGSTGPESTSTAGQPARRTAAAKRPPVAPPATTDADTSDGATGLEPVEALCGHKNMSGRSCTRPHGHSEKSHRYS